MGRSVSMKESTDRLRGEDSYARMPASGDWKIEVTASRPTPGQANTTSTSTTPLSINASIGRDPQFFRRLVEIVFRYTADPSHQAAFWRPWGAWVFSAKNLIVPVAALLVSAVVLVHPSRRLPALHRLVIAEFVGIAVLWCVWQSLGQTALDWEYFAYPLIPQMFLAISALVHWRVGSIPAVVVTAAPLVMTAALVLNAVGIVQPFVPTSPAAAFGVLVALAIFCQASLWLPPPRLGIVVFVIAGSLVNALAAFSTTSYMARQPCQTGADFQAAVIAAHRFAAENDPALKDVTVWFQEGELLAVGGPCPVNLGYLGYAVAASGIPHRANPFPWPALEAIPDEDIADVTRPRRTLLVLSSEPAIQERVSRRFASMGIQATLTNSRTITIAEGRLSALLFKLQPRTSS